MTPQDAISRISDVAEKSDLIRALFMSGSYGSGLQDEYSDLDFLAIVDSDNLDAFSAIWREAVEQAGPIVLWWDRQVKGMLINAITQSWLRIDVVALGVEHANGHARSQLKVIFDKDKIADQLPNPIPGPQVSPARLSHDFQEFVRIMGLLPVAIGRNELVNAVTGLVHLRRMLIELLILETDAPNRGGALHLNRLISPDQNQLLKDLPPLMPERDAIIRGHLEYAKAYLPRAKRLAQQYNVTWPHELEAATWSHLRATLGVSEPDVAVMA
ncbi:hypothetical protein GCM10007385_42940 [Tateyamaria omphalii]|uniref:aminoglycoside 6-adenylyltransferase n=1 Tax=Tateyamaria omphalii TaxID=299262 RepID=UPI00167B3E8F|nr:aminoglycoside 6-adenylyltransferase [Tateyamaria omphalii]GGX69207.1 hypothetical protein GCM10007385_42940 [Tateyamaria omphalii]